MSRRNTFRRINKSHLEWQLNLREGEGAQNYSDWLWLDGKLEGGYQFQMGMFLARATEMGGSESSVKRGYPVIDLHIQTPDRKKYYRREIYSPESFKPEPFGGTWGNERFVGRLNSDGLPEGYELKVTLGDLGLDLTARTVAIGLVFSDEEHGYSYYNPIKKAALGWWPLIPRSVVKGTITIEGKQLEVNGLVYVERQVSSIPRAFGSGGQAWWTWGHFFADDFTAIWTDSAASERYQYRHFSPFALWKGSELIFSTFQFTVYIEKFGFDPESKFIYPIVESLRASDGNTELKAQLTNGRINHTFQVGKKGQYVRQSCDVNMQLRRWEVIEEASGSANHEFGAGDQWFPYERLK